MGLHKIDYRAFKTGVAEPSCSINTWEDWENALVVEPALARDRAIARVPVQRLRWWLDDHLSRIPIQRRRWWLVERPGIGGETTSVAYEDPTGLWWEYEPETRMLHDTPWLFTDYHFRRGNPYLFTLLTPAEARTWIARDIGRRDSEQLLMGRRRDERALDPVDLLGPIDDSG